jgi:hypothetical protein
MSLVIKDHDDNDDNPEYAHTGDDVLAETEALNRIGGKRPISIQHTFEFEN